MKKKLLLFMAMVLACGVILAPKAAMAADDTETYGVTIPAATQVVLVAGSNITLLAADVAATTDTDGTNTLVVGDGAVATSASYVQTTDSASAAAAQYTITFAANGGTTPVLTEVGGAGNGLLLTLTNGDNELTLDIRKNTSTTPTEYPLLGDPAGTPIEFAFNAGTMNIAAASTVPFDGATNKAPLDMWFDVNESSVFYDDDMGTYSFDMTFTAVGL